MTQNGGSHAVADVLRALTKLQGDGKLGGQDVLHIKKVLESSQIRGLINVYDKLCEIRGEAGIPRDVTALTIAIMAELERYDDSKCRELFGLLSNPYFRGLLDAHDNIIYESYKCNPVLPAEEDIRKADEIGPPIRVIGLTKSRSEPLGVHIGKHFDNCIYIKRILPGTMVEKQGLLSVGDIIKEINGQPTPADPVAVEERLTTLDGGLTLKVIPSFRETQGNCHVFLRCHFDYKHAPDGQSAKAEKGLPFKKKDIIEITDQSDSRWWLAMHTDGSGKSGLVPSLKYEQMRRTYSPTFKGEKLFKGKKKIVYRASEHATFDCLDVPVYEEVTKMPPMERKLIVLMGAEAAGRRELKNKLIENDPSQYVAILPDTSRTPRDDERSGVGYHFVDRKKMASNISAGMYFEWGEYNGHFYGTRLDAIRDVMNAGKICVVDCYPPALKILKTAEFMPLIVFIEVPDLNQLLAMNREKDLKDQKTGEQMHATVEENNFIKEKYHHYFDIEVKGGDCERTYNALKAQIQTFLQEPQWVPVSWVY